MASNFPKEEKGKPPKLYQIKTDANILKHFKLLKFKTFVFCVNKDWEWDMLEIK